MTIKKLTNNLNALHGAIQQMNKMIKHDLIKMMIVLKTFIKK